jgi:hypothetical protein
MGRGMTISQEDFDRAFALVKGYCVRSFEAQQKQIDDLQRRITDLEALAKEGDGK